MKKTNPSLQKRQKINKGLPSAVVLSILIHATLFILAGMLVVFTVVKKEEKKFEPPQAVERPKMKLKKPKVKIKKTSRPKPTQRIVTRVNRASMPDIQLPEMSAMGEGLSGGLGGFDLMPDVKMVDSLFGSGQSVGSDFVGVFYDLKRDRSGRDIPLMDPYGQMDLVRKFIESGWKTSVLARYYQSPKKLYASSFMIPSSLSSFVPPLFGEPENAGYLWMVHYKGLLVYPEDITFRFFGFADEFMVVRVDGEVVLSCANPVFIPAITPHWQSSSADSLKYKIGGMAIAGDWITLEAGVSKPMEVLIAEGPGGGFASMLVVQVKGVEYERNKLGDPIMPMFKTAEPSPDLLDAIVENLIPGEADPTNGPVFCDFSQPDHSLTIEPTGEDALNAKPLPEESAVEKIRTWGKVNGKTLEAEFVTVLGEKVVLRDTSGKLLKIPLVEISGEDRLFIELAQPPKFKIDFIKKSNQVIVPTGTPFWDKPSVSRSDFDYTFGVRLKQYTAGEYNHELKVEFFAIGEEVDGDNYILLDRQESRFALSRENDYSYTFYGDTVRLTKFMFSGLFRGQKYGGYLVVVTDSLGNIIDQGATSKWLPGILPQLRTLPVGRHFNKNGTRVFPPSPERKY